MITEWEDLVDAWQLETWESYRDIKRLGRKTRLQESQRAALWAVLDVVRGRLRAEGYITYAELFTRLAGSWRPANIRRLSLSWSMKLRI